MGFTPNVVDGDIILASWGNQIRDRTVQVFATVGERDTQWPSPPEGAMCYVTATGSWYVRGASQWLPVIKSDANTFMWIGAHIVVTTDGAANFAISTPGYLCYVAIATPSMRDLPFRIAHNADDWPVPSGGAAFTVFNPDGVKWPNGTFRLDYLLGVRPI